MHDATLRQVSRQINVLDPDLPTLRLLEVRDDYRRRLGRRGPGDPPAWYCRAVIAEAGALLAARKAVA